MREIDIAEGMGKEIIKQLHNYYEEITMDDVDYIPLIKRVIKAIYNHTGSYNISEFDNRSLQKRLLTYAKDLYVEICMIHAKEDNEDITHEEVKKESEELFYYIYEHGEYPNQFPPGNGHFSQCLCQSAGSLVRCTKVHLRVMPVKTGIQWFLILNTNLDFRLRGNDDYRIIIFDGAYIFIIIAC